MLFWIVIVLLAFAVSGFAVWPLLRRPAGPAEESDVALYREQLAEVDRDLARGTIGTEEAERARTEIARRLLAADRAGPAPLAEAPRGATRALAVAALVVVGGGSLALYATLGRPDLPDWPLQDRLARAEELRATRIPQEEAEAIVAARAAEAPDPAEEFPEDYMAMVEQLREIVPTRPDDLGGWELLARHEALTGRFPQAARAQAHVLELKGDAATAEDHARLADLLVAAAGGFVSAEAEAQARIALETDPTNSSARYTLGLLYVQTDRPDLAFRLWRPVAEGGAPNAVQTRLARSQIESVAAAAGIDYRLETPRGPSAADMAAAEEMDPEARAAMVEGMVQQLSDRLASEGGPASDWARLIASLAVLGDMERAQAILAEAREVFADSPDAIAEIEAAADAAGLTP
ncbi:c-type cytochrome biogenesis protein CcmI [Wenxinia marina]|uniref:Cytochrome c-type biogenesis protein CcmI n=1 Tax=Wenxinia marina DSM 24838 TaxID=1123501 RepID=A0A0D0PD28_9RHOB|nr:c-type cytochrome biogenesis protein CcmI [Wenxinia marina]KIQ69361.1 cytochrome c-type biogenesis protein CcmI [Wenxinia marina DSM 24838]GGL57707.1 c-type cytochrome biogenesis protein CcmI [Wenxinia marina]